MKAVDIHLDLDLLKNSNLNLTGKIHIKINDFYFPERDWNDLIFAVLANWSIQADNLNSNRLNNATFYFMDGPLRFIITKTGENYDIEFVHVNTIVKTFKSLAWEQFLSEFKSKSYQILEEYFKISNQSNTDIDLLSKYVGFKI